MQFTDHGRIQSIRSFRGGAIALHAGKTNLFFVILLHLSLSSPGLTASRTLAGVIALSTWLPLPATFPQVG